MSPNPNVELAARVIAAAVVHGVSTDVAREVATALDDARLLVRPAAIDPFAVPGRNRPAPSPGAVAALIASKEAKRVADTAVAAFADMPGEPEVTASGGEVRIVTHPQSLDEWNRWTTELRVKEALSKSTGVAVIARCTYGGVRARLVGYGVPALLAERLPDTSPAAGR